MAFDYINEAFKRLNLLEESMFDTSVNGVNNLAAFLDEDDPTVKVIDTEATDEDSLKDSYVGKVIVNCNICHSNIFKNKEDIVIDEEGLVNPEDACPYCGEQEGFTVIGEIIPYGAASTESTDDELDVSIENEASEEETTEEPVLEEGLLGAVGLGLAAGAASAVGNKVTSSMLSDDVNDTTEDELLNEDESTTSQTKELSRASRRATMTEDFKEVSITTDDQHMEMTSDENGKVTVTTEPVQETPATDSVEEVIAPLSNETEEEILTNNNTEEPVEEVSTEDIPTEDSEEFVADFDDIDEEGLDELGESYLKKIYENVDSFKTTSVGANQSSLIIEGLITFSSGAKKKTGFVFEAKDANNRGQLRFIGSNKQLTESKDAFTLIGRLDNKKLFVESLKYNYSVNNDTVRGIVRRK